MNWQAWIIFYLHALVLVYCLFGSLLEFADWLIPNVLSFYVLFGSALIFPVLAVIVNKTFTGKKPITLVSLHCVMSALQAVFMLLWLISE